MVENAGKDSPSESGGLFQHGMRHSIVRTQLPPVELVPDEIVRFGRARDCQFFIPAPKVSRYHAEIYWKDGQAWLRDLGSQNGSIVNGRRVLDYQLQDGDEISLGPFLCTYRCIGIFDPVKELQSPMSTTAGTLPVHDDSISGKLEQMNLFELLQTLEFTQKSGTLELLITEVAGTVDIQKGQPVFARFGERKGDEAVLALLQSTEGYFYFGPTLEQHQPNMTSTITQLLFEAGRRIDETSSNPILEDH